MQLVAGTNPLNDPVLIGCVDILPKLHQKVLIPTAVRRELLSVSAPALVREWAIDLPDWVEVIDPTPEFLNDPQLAALHDGEQAALALAAGRQPIVLLVDEWPARNIASKKGFRVTGTIGVLDQAALQKLTSFAEAIDKLKRTSFRYPASLVERLLVEHTSGS